jgi:hypothetical protein
MMVMEGGGYIDPEEETIGMPDHHTLFGSYHTINII